LLLPEFTKHAWIELVLEEEAKNAIEIPDEEHVAEYYEYRQQLDQLAADFREVITHPSYSLPFLLPGRLVKIKYQTLDFGWGVVINFQKRLPPKVHIHLLFSFVKTDYCCTQL
jgi:ATP-dependent RNA helicase DOB1